MEQRECCAIGCGKTAEFTVYGSSGHPEDVTDAYEDHVGVLLGTLSWMIGENTSWTVYPISAKVL